MLKFTKIKLQNLYMTFFDRLNSPRYVQDSSDVENRHLTYQISSPARDSEIFLSARGSPGRF